MLKTLITGLLMTSTVIGLCLEAKAESYGEGDKWYMICNNTNESNVTYYTDVTAGEHSLNKEECDTIWTNDEYILVEYDESWAKGNQLYEVRVDYPNDLNFIHWDNDYYGEIIGHEVD